MNSSRVQNWFSENQRDLNGEYYSRMSDVGKDVTFSLKVMVNKQKSKVLFAEVDGSFVDVLLSFLTLPLGTIVRILKKNFEDEAPAFRSLSSLYNSLANLDSSHFRTADAKSNLLNPRRSSDAQLEDFVQPNELRLRSFRRMYSEIQQRSEARTVASDGVFMISAASFLITDDLQIVPNTGLLQIVNVLGIREMNKAETMNITFGKAEVMDLLKASLTSSTPLSDIILNKKKETMNSRKRRYEESMSVSNEVGNASNDYSNSKKVNLKVILQKSTNKLLYAEAEEDFVECLFGLLKIPLGGVEYLLGRNPSIKSIDNMYMSVVNSIDDKYFKNPDAKNRLIKPKISHRYINSQNHFLPLTEEGLPDVYRAKYFSTSVKSPRRKGKYLKGLRTYKVADDLTVTPFCIVSVLSSLEKLKIQISDVKELQMQIGLKEVLSILNASLTSTSALTDALLMHQKSNKQPKPEL